MNSPYRRLMEKSHSTVDSDSTWLITLSDVLTLLLVFFVVFLMAKHLELKKAAQATSTQAPSSLPAESAAQLRDEMASRIKELGLEGGATVRAAGGDVVITLTENITFRPGEAEMLPGSAPLVEGIAALIMDKPLCRVEIDGHTDNVPIHTPRFPSNWELSTARATSVLRYFIETQGIDPARFTLRGNADHRPVAPNDTAEQRARNRRVEIRLKNAA